MDKPTIIEPQQREKESYLWPAVQAGASIMSVIGGIVGLSVNPENRNNPFFYTAIANPLIYACINIYRCREVIASNHRIDKENESRRKSFADRITEERIEIRIL